jgi:hypothetical protein
MEDLDHHRRELQVS